MPPVLDYESSPAPASNWPWPILIIIGVAGIMLAPSVACACWKGEYKTELVMLASTMLLVRTIVAAARAERSYTWIAYIAVLIAAFILGPTLIECVLR